MSKVLCLDTSVLVPYLVPEQFSSKAESLILQGIEASARFVVPSFAWAELGSVLRKKIRMGMLTAEEAQACFEDFGQLPLEFMDNPAIRQRSWVLASQHGLPTLYDAAFLACTELCSAEFWTADQALVKQLSPCPDYVHALGD